MGDLPQKKRLQVIEGIKTGEIKYLVATEVAARGLHIDDLDLVINYDLPAESESYVHRIGRTARVGKSGKAISFACDKYVYGLEGIESFTKMKIPVVWADDALFEKDKSEGMTFRQPKGSRMMRPEGRPSVKTKHTPAVKGTASSGKKPRRVSRRDRHAPAETSQGISITREHTGTAKGASPPKHRKVSRPEPRKTVSRPGRNSTPEERLAYYKKKYGEDFTAHTPETLPPSSHQKPGRKKSLLKKIRDFLTK
jgi:ATP-dependent RNA helicase RhlB